MVHSVVRTCYIGTQNTDKTRGFIKGRKRRGGRRMRGETWKDLKEEREKRKERNNVENRD